jgi:probable DNA metabolism protein
MRDIIDDESLVKLFDIPGMKDAAGLPETLSGQGGLFEDTCPPAPLEQISLELYRLSPKVYNAAVLAAMSDPPPAEAIRRFCRKALSSGAAGADRVMGDCGDDEVRAVLEAAAKVTREIDRLRGLLRFRADGAGMYLARCAPDHFVLPALAAHFELRFGETPWAIIDEKRRLALPRPPGGEPRLVRVDAPAFREEAGGCSREQPPWEDVWRTYHRSVNNESRANPELQRQFMPARYWKYLTED